MVGREDGPQMDRFCEQNFFFEKNFFFLDFFDLLLNKHSFGVFLAFSDPIFTRKWLYVENETVSNFSIFSPDSMFCCFLGEHTRKNACGWC